MFVVNDRWLINCMKFLFHFQEEKRLVLTETKSHKKSKVLKCKYHVKFSSIHVLESQSQPPCHMLDQPYEESDTSKI
jgi:hypothetical protein